MSYNNATVIPFMGLTHIINQEDKLAGLVLTNHTGVSIGFDKSFITTTFEGNEYTQPLTREALVAELSVQYAHVILYSDLIDIDVLIDTSGHWIGFTNTEIHMGTHIEDLTNCIVLPYTLSIISEVLINKLQVS